MAIRVKQFWQYMVNKVEAARRAIYDFAKPITGVAVEGHLKEFSGVPTKVSIIFVHCADTDFRTLECLC